ncbi:MAG: IS4 family transposase [Kamptonema sp. SIO4C4]|nr:IS4 family transposase [Kamptonema sp. SIO4C4]
MAHSQKSIKDHARGRNQPNIDNEAIAQQLEDLIKPSVYQQLAYYRSLGMRERILSLPFMVAVVLSLLWRQVPSVRELNRMLAREDLLWAKATKVSQQALSQRFLTFPAQVFERVLKDLLPQLQKSWQQRQKRPHPRTVTQAKQHYEHLWIIDASTLEALFRKLKSLETVPLGQLAGRICAVLDLETHFPVETWFSSQPYHHETHFTDSVLGILPQKTLLLIDRGFWNFGFFEQIVQAQSDLITRYKKGAKYKTLRTLSHSNHHRDQRIRLGRGYQGNPILEMRLVEVRHGSTWYRYLTSVLDPEILPPFAIADLYARRWRIEDTFKTLKHLLGLSYLWTGSMNGIQLQLWATWLFYVVLIDLSDQVAEQLTLPFERISVEMVFRGLYHFSQAEHRGETSDPVAYLTAPENQDLGVIKALRRKRQKPPVDLSPFPGQKGLTSAAFS